MFTSCLEDSDGLRSRTLLTSGLVNPSNSFSYLWAFLFEPCCSTVSDVAHQLLSI